MNANTALKINDAVSQAISCGESVDAILDQVRKTAAHALRARAEEQIAKLYA